MRDRVRRLLPGVWAGVLVCIAAIAAPSAFAVLAVPDAGRVVNRIFAQEAYLSLAVAMVLFLLERRAARDAAEAGRGSVFSTEMMLVLGTLFCTLAGWFALQPMMAAARAGQGSVSFGVLHGATAAFFCVKALLALVLAWRALRPPSS